MTFFLKMATIVSLAVILMIFFLRPGGLLASTELGHVFAMVLSLDSFKVYPAAGLSSDIVDVYWTDELESRRVRIIHKGKKDEAFPQEYGGNFFTIEYDGNILLYRQRQIKFAWWHYHSYAVRVFLDHAGSLKAEMSVVGPDPLVDATLK